MPISATVKYHLKHDRFKQVWISLYRRAGTEPDFRSPVKTGVFMTPTDEKQRKWTNKVSLSALRHMPGGDG